MLKEALAYFRDTAVEANGPHELPSGDRHAKRRLLPGGAVDEAKDTFPPRGHTVFDIDSLATYSETAVIWHCDKEVVAVLDDGEYRDNRVTMPLPIHPKFDAIQKQCHGKFSQKSLIDFLRLNLKAEIDNAAPGFIASLRLIRIQQSTAGDASIQHGRESMGKRIDNAVTGADAIPEEVLLRVPLWLHLDAIVEIEFAFDINVEDATFAFRPKPGELEKAMVHGQEWLHAQLAFACESATILFGKP